MRPSWLPRNPDLTFRFCPSCNRREAAHIKGVCVFADRHADKVCESCGRQCAGPRCSACEASAS